MATFRTGFIGVFGLIPVSRQPSLAKASRIMGRMLMPHKRPRQTKAKIAPGTVFLYECVEATVKYQIEQQVFDKRKGRDVFKPVDNYRIEVPGSTICYCGSKTIRAGMKALAEKQAGTTR